MPRTPPPVCRTHARTALARVKNHFSPGLALGAKLAGLDAVEEEASGAVVTLSDGRSLLDFGSYGVTLLGHRHPTIVAAIERELELMPTGTKLLAHPTSAAFAAELVERCGDPLRRVWIGSDGSDVVEASLKLARRRTGQMRVLAVEGAFHGKTLGALALTSNPAFRAGLEPLLREVTHLAVDDALAVRREAERGDVAALIFEPVQGEAGVRLLDPSILRRWADDAHAAGCYVISDEVQAGLGRVGSFSPSLAAGIEVDAVLFGKALGGGLIPLSAMVATESMAEPLVTDPTWHTSTFGGHPLACAAGRATLSTLDETRTRGREVGAAFGTGLEALASEQPEAIIEVRGAGLMWGLELASPGAVGAALIELARRGLLVSPCLSSNRTLRLLPPMVTSPSQVEQALEIVAATMSSVGVFVKSSQRD